MIICLRFIVINLNLYNYMPDEYNNFNFWFQDRDHVRFAGRIGQPTRSARGRPSPRTNSGSCEMSSNPTSIFPRRDARRWHESSDWTSRRLKSGFRINARKSRRLPVSGMVWQWSWSHKDFTTTKQTQSSWKLEGC